MGTAEKNVSQPSQGQCIAPEKAISGRTRRSISWVSAREIMVSALLMLCAMFPSWGLNCSGAKQIHGELSCGSKKRHNKVEQTVATTVATKNGQESSDWLLLTCRHAILMAGDMKKAR